MSNESQWRFINREVDGDDYRDFDIEYFGKKPINVTIGQVVITWIRFNSHPSSDFMLEVKITKIDGIKIYGIFQYGYFDDDVLEFYSKNGPLGLETRDVEVELSMDNIFI